MNYRLKMLGEKELCLIIDVPLTPELKSIAAVRPFRFPTIKDNTLFAPRNLPPPFLQFQGSFYVKLDMITFNDCTSKGICSGPWAPEIADEEANCALDQYFNNASAEYPLVEVPDKRFTLYGGSMLFYALLRPIRVSFTCTNKNVKKSKKLEEEG